MAISVSDIDNAVQLRLRNIVNSPLSQSTRIEGYNRVIDFLQSKSNWNFCRRVASFDFLDQETEYSMANDLLVTDFKQVDDLRFSIETNQFNDKKFEEIDNTDFSVYERQRVFNSVYAFEDRDNATVLRVLASLGKGNTTVDELDDLTTGRTWVSDTVNSQATTLVQDTTKAKVGNSLRCNILTTQSSTFRSTIYTSVTLTTPIDGSAIENFGYFRFWLGLHSMIAANLGRITNVTFIWGSDTNASPTTRANYWTQTATAPALGGSFRNTWNRMSFPWSTATKTGSPSSSSLRYFEIQLNYSSALTSTNNIRFDQIKMYEPAEAEFVYYSTNFVVKNGVQQANFSSPLVGTENLLLPQKHMNLFVNLALMELFPQKDRKTDDYKRVQELAMKQLDLAILQDGNSLTRSKKEFSVDGFSRGREDVSNASQW